jgi:hypothetical protein
MEVYEMFMRMYSTSSWTELIKYTASYIVRHSLECSPVLSSSKGSISATGRNTSGTKFLESHVRWAATVPKFHGNPGNNTLSAQISFMEPIKYRNWPKQASTKCGGTTTLFLTAKIAALTEQLCQHNFSLTHCKASQQ